MNIVYRFETPEYSGNILYVNVVPKYKCVNECGFCSRQDAIAGKPNIYEKKTGCSLYLPRKPTIDEVMREIDREIKQDDEEIAIIGLGEPLIYLPTVTEVLNVVNKRYKINTRVDTNGLVGCMYDDSIQRLEDVGLSKVSISLNAINQQDYDKLCKPRFDNAWKKLIEAIEECVVSSIDTHTSFVVNFEPMDEQELIDFAVSLGVDVDNVHLRDYVLPSSQ
jgi:GTP 3',8-cyclase